MNKITKAVIPIAGLGTRMLPITKTVPKELLPIHNIPIIEFIVQEAIDSGIKEILFIINDQKKLIKDYFEKNHKLEKILKEKNQQARLRELKESHKKVKISYVFQTEPSGSGAALKLAKEFVKDQWFAVLYGDDLFFTKKPVLKQLIEHHQLKKAGILAVKEVDMHQKSLYGIIEADKGKMVKLIEKPKKNETISNLASLGRYIFPPTIFEEITGEYRDGQEILLTTAIENLAKKQDFFVCKIKATHYDTGSKEGYIEAFTNYNKKETK